MDRITRRGLFLGLVFSPLLIIGLVMVVQEPGTGTVIPALLFVATWASAVIAGRAQARASYAAGPVPPRARLVELAWLVGTAALLIAGIWSATAL